MKNLQLQDQPINHVWIRFFRYLFFLFVHLRWSVIRMDNIFLSFWFTPMLFFCSVAVVSRSNDFSGILVKSSKKATTETTKIQMIFFYLLLMLLFSRQRIASSWDGLNTSFVFFILISWFSYSWSMSLF